MSAPVRHDFDVVVLGASAGGVAALHRLLAALAADFPLPLLIVQHLPPDRVSQLAQVLGNGCALSVREAVDKQPLRAGEVILAPPDYHLLVEDATSVALSRDPAVLFSRPAIDVLFESAADVFGPRTLAILLTGASADGSAGVAAVRTAGGAAWVQDPDDAVSPTMPASALASAGADAVLTLEALCTRLADWPR